ncbi:hypothetical protein BH24ACT3_BH24ACT3_03290 [soil metagenome]
MAVITEDAIRELAGFKGEEAPVTTCYLDVDGRRFHRHQDYEQELDRVLRDARAKLDGGGDLNGATASVRDDLRHIEEYVRAGFDRSRTRGLVIFACSAHGLWQVVPLPVPVRSRVVINHTPAVAQLESVVQEYDRFGVLLADRQRARMFVFELGELLECSERVDELPRDYDDRGERERGDVAPHVAELAHQHLRRAAAMAFKVFQEHGFDRLTIGAPEPLTHELEAALHPYLRERLCARIDAAVGASTEEVRSAALELEAEVEREREMVLVERLREAVGAGRRGVAGLEAVLGALAERRVEHLLVSEDYAEPGWRCPETEVLAVKGPKSPVTGRPMDRVDDVVEDAVEEAMNQGCDVEICRGNADLDVLGRIGALLRY